MNPLTYALLAQAAYSAVPQIGNEDSSARAVYGHTADGLAVAFPGTNNVACWLADLDCQAVQTPLGGLHKGFADAFDVIRDPLMALAGATDQPIIPCGHSEGAALALRYAGELCLAGRPPKAVFAFEPPRMCIDDVLRDLFLGCGVELRLFVNGNDVVPLVPRILLPWRHPGPLTKIGKAAEMFPNIVDHEMTRVVAAVRALVPA